MFYSWYLGGFLIILPDLVLSSTFDGVDAGVCFALGLGVVVDWPDLLLVFDGLSDIHLFISWARLVAGGTSNLDDFGKKGTLVPHKWMRLHEISLPSSVATT